MLTIDEVKPLVKKPQIAKTLACSPRQVDNYMAQGMPHQKPSPRKVTFDTAEVLKWYKEQYGLQRRKSLANN
jgi:phage terminase Nu1 subunit (DNA packaging protein)